MSDLNLTDAARKMITADVNAEGTAAKRFKAYVTEASVTLDTVSDHVAEFRAAFVAKNKNATGDEIKAYATLVRNRMNRALGKDTNAATQATALITSLGVKSTLAEVTAAWKAAQK